MEFVLSVNGPLVLLKMVIDFDASSLEYTELFKWPNSAHYHTLVDPAHIFWANYKSSLGFAAIQIVYCILILWDMATADHDRQEQAAHR